MLFELVLEKSDMIISNEVKLYPTLSVKLRITTVLEILISQRIRHTFLEEDHSVKLWANEDVIISHLAHRCITYFA